MKLMFQSGNEIVKLVIDRKNKTLQAASSVSNYNLIPKPYSDLFDKGRELLQERVTDKMNDDDFIDSVIIAMAKAGYRITERD